MKYFIQRYTKEIAKKILSIVSSLFSMPLNKEDTRDLDLLEEIFKTDSFELSMLMINGIRKKLPVNVCYSESKLFKIRNSKNQLLRILPSGGICSDKKYFVLDLIINNRSTY